MDKKGSLEATFGEKKAPGEEFTIPTDRILFNQPHVQAKTIEAKRLALHLQNKYGPKWKQHTDEVRETPTIIAELKRIDLDIPEVVETPDGNYVVRNGTNTAYAQMKNKYTRIKVKKSPLALPKTATLYTFDQMRIE